VHPYRPGSSAPPCTARGASATSTPSRAVHPICGASRRAAASRRITRGEPTIAAAPCPSRASPFGRSLAVTGVRAEERGAEPIANSRIVTPFSRPALTPLSGIDATLNTTSPTVISATRATTRWSRPWVATPNTSSSPRASAQPCSAPARRSRRAWSALSTSRPTTAPAPRPCVLRIGRHERPPRHEGAPAGAPFVF
jgi:hypothetical protein